MGRLEFGGVVQMADESGQALLRHHAREEGPVGPDGFDLRQAVSLALLLACQLAQPVPTKAIKSPLNLYTLSLPAHTPHTHTHTHTPHT